MKHWLTLCLTLCVVTILALPAAALDYTIDAPDSPEYGKPTSIEVIHTADGGAAKNEDRSKNAALIPPAFGSPSMDTRNTGSYLTPNLAPGGAPLAGVLIDGTASAVVTPGTPTLDGSLSASSGYTEVSSDLYYSDGSLGTLKIPALDLSVRIYEGTDDSALRKGAGHFTDTSIWDGNVCLAAHNRGISDYFGEIHTLEIGDKLSLTTKLGTRTYAVTSVEKVDETDTSGLALTTTDQLTLYTCVRDQRESRWKVVSVV